MSILAQPITAHLEEHLLTEPEVRDLDDAVLVHEAVAGGEVAVDELAVGEVDHTRQDLLGHADLGCR